MKTPKIFKLNDETYRVKKKDYYQNVFKQGCAYTLGNHNDYVYPFRGVVESYDECWRPGIYMVDEYPVVIRPKTDEDRLLYSKKNIITLTPDCIFKDLNSITPTVADLPVIADTDGDIFKPTIRPSDDIALAGMKYAIGQKNINFNTYAYKFTDPATKNNGRRALTYGNSLKMEMLTRFAEVFDINAAVLFWDKQGTPNPMDPERKTIYYICDSDDLDFSDETLTFKEICKD